MKIGIITLLFLLSFYFVHAQNPNKIEIQSGGYTREYLLYTPKNYTTDKPTGLIVCLHGFNRTMTNFFDEYDINKVADSLNMIILAPQALPEQSTKVIESFKIFTNYGVDIPLNAVWGCGLTVKATFMKQSIVNEELNKSVDDITFINEIVNTTLAGHYINPANLFLLGTSLGGFMSYQYATLYSNKLAGLVSVCGSMGTSIKMPTTAEIPGVSICDFHSITDEVIPYEGFYTEKTDFGDIQASICQPKADVVHFWTVKNGTAETPVINDVNYYPSNNGKTVKKYTYVGVDKEVLHYKIDGAGHEYYFRKENGDCMDYNEEIIKFIRSHIEVEFGISSPKIVVENLTVFPNPTIDHCIVKGTQASNRKYQESNQIHLYNMSGMLMDVYIPQPEQTEIDLSIHAKGVYLLKYNNKTTKVVKL